MKNTCKNCGKYLDDIDDFGYCKKCSAKLFKKNKHTTEEQRKIKTIRKRIITIILLIVIVVLFIVFKDNILDFTYKILTSSDSIVDVIPDEITSAIIPIEDQILTAENYTNLTTEFSEKNKDTDDFCYFLYAALYNSFTGAISSTDSTDSTMNNIYGKTINELISEGKDLMKQNNISVEEYRQNLNEFIQSIDELNQSINEINSMSNQILLN